jgi:hypothetical protein
MDKALTLEESQFSISEKVTYRIEELEPGRDYRIHFTTIPGMAGVGSYRGVLKLKTNYPEKPDVTIWITVQYRKPSQG